MFVKKVLGRTIAAAATTGVIAAPMAFVAAPQLVNVACTDNPSETTVSLRLDRSEAQYGTKTMATATVNPAPTGTDSFVEYRVFIEDRTFATYTKRAETDGTVSRLLPRGLAAGRTYQVEARFQTCEWSAPVSYTVNEATSKPVPSVLNARRAKFSTTVTGGGGLDPDAGPATFKVRKRGGPVIRDTTEWLTDGVATVNLKNLPRGRYLLKVIYEGNRNFLRGATKVRFRVR